MRTILVLLLLALPSFAILGSTPEVVEWKHPNITTDFPLNAWVTLGEFTVPDKVADDGTWEEINMSVLHDYSCVGYVRNASAGPVASSGTQTPANYHSISGLGLYFFHKGTNDEAVPGWFPQGSIMEWPAMSSMAPRHTHPSGPLLTVDYDVAWESWIFPTAGYSGWDEGDVIEVRALGVSAFNGWDGWQNDPTGEFPYGTSWTNDIELSVWWDQQPQ